MEEERKREMGKKERAGVLNKIISDHSIILATTKVDIKADLASKILSRISAIVMLPPIFFPNKKKVGPFPCLILASTKQSLVF